MRSLLDELWWTLNSSTDVHVLISLPLPTSLLNESGRAGVWKCANYAKNNLKNWRSVAEVEKPMQVLKKSLTLLHLEIGLGVYLCVRSAVNKTLCKPNVTRSMKTLSRKKPVHDIFHSRKNAFTFCLISNVWDLYENRTVFNNLCFQLMSSTLKIII